MSSPPTCANTALCFFTSSIICARDDEPGKAARRHWPTSRDHHAGNTSPSHISRQLSRRPSRRHDFAAVASHFAGHRRLLRRRHHGIELLLMRAASGLRALIDDDHPSGLSLRDEEMRDDRYCIAREKRAEREREREIDEIYSIHIAHARANTIYKN